MLFVNNAAADDMSISVRRPVVKRGVIVPAYCHPYFFTIFSCTADSTQFVFFGRLLVREVLREKVLRGAKKQGRRFLVFWLF